MLPRHVLSSVCLAGPDVNQDRRHPVYIPDIFRFVEHVPCGLVVRIPRSHRGGRGSIPRMGKLYFTFKVHLCWDIVSMLSSWFYM